MRQQRKARRWAEIQGQGGEPLLRHLDLHGCKTGREAVRVLTSEISLCKKSGCQILKVIHGYGSTGRGGALYQAVREYLATTSTTTTAFIPGEQWNVANELALAAIDQHPSLRYEPDLNRENLGITLILIRAKAKRVIRYD